MTRLPLWVKDDGTVYGLLTMMTRLVISSSLSLSVYRGVVDRIVGYTGLFCESR